MGAAGGVSRPTASRAGLGAAALAAIALVGLVGCNGGSEEGPARGNGLPPTGGGGTLGYALPTLPSTPDPLAAGSRAEQTVVRQLYEPLIGQLSGPYAEQAPQPGLALTARPSRDRTIWTVTLRTDVRFQDGMPLNAGAVVANSRRWQSDPAGRRLLPYLFAVDAPRPDEVRFQLDRPVPDLSGRLASPRLGIVSPLALDPQSGRGARFLAEAAGSGTGPFQPGPRGPGRLTLSRFAGWWGSSLGLGPSLDGITFQLAPRPATRLRMLQEGLVQVADPLDAEGLREADADPLLNSIGGPLTGIGLDGSVRGIDSAAAIPVLSGVWLTRLTG